MLIRYYSDAFLSRISFWDIKSADDDEYLYDDNKTKLKALQANLAKSIISIYNNEKAYYEPFYKKVDEVIDNAPSYYSIVSVPMYIDLIVQRLQNGFYNNIESIKFDINLIVSNCSRYNTEGSKLSSYGHKLVKQTIQALTYLSDTDNNTTENHNTNNIIVNTNNNIQTRHSRLTRNIDIPKEVLEDTNIRKSLRSKGSNRPNNHNRIKVPNDDIEVNIDDSNPDSDDYSLPKDGRYLRHKRQRSTNRVRINI
jgi:hypothetical protein